MNIILNGLHWVIHRLRRSSNVYLNLKSRCVHKNKYKHTQNHESFIHFNTGIYS